MAIKIENATTQAKLPKNTTSQIEKMVESVPRDHLHGLERLRLVDVILDPRIRPNAAATSSLPGLYHPRQGTQKAWLEIAIGTLLPSHKSFYQRIMPRLSFKANLAAVIFSLIGQHYHLTLKHSLKRGQIEAGVRAYTEKQMRYWSERQHTWRSRLLKPLQPTFERWSRSLQQKAAAEKRRKKLMPE